MTLKSTLLILLCLVAVVSAKFFVIKEKKNFTDAVQLCQRNGYFLFHARGVIKNRQGYSLMKKLNFKRMWLAVSRRANSSDVEPWNWHYEGKMKSPVKTNFWGVGEPNNFRNHNEYCVEMRRLEKNGHIHNWNDRPCDSLNPFICETYWFWK